MINNWKIEPGKWKIAHLKSGQMIIVALIFLTVTLILVGSLFSRTAQFIRFGGGNLRQEQAINLAEAGADYAIWQLNESAGGYNPGAGQTINIPATPPFAGQATIKFLSGGGSLLKKIEVTGCVPDCTNPREKQTVKLDAGINSEDIAFNYALQTGSGGLIMSGGSRVDNGNVWAGYKNGPITNIDGSGGSIINGEAWATGTISTVVQGLTVNPEPNSRHPTQDPATAPDLPTFDYQEYRDAAESVPANNPCEADGIIASSVTIGPCKQVGDLTISGGTTTIAGPVWVTGNFSMTGPSTRLKLSDIFGGGETVFLVDTGTITIEGNSAVEPNNAVPNKGYLLVATTNTSDAACTSPQAMNIAGGTQTGIFYVLEGRACLSGSANLTGLVAKTVGMSGGSILTYEVGLASSSFSSGPGGSWQATKGTYRFSTSP